MCRLISSEYYLSHNIIMPAVPHQFEVIFQRGWNLEHQGRVGDTISVFAVEQVVPHRIVGVVSFQGSYQHYEQRTRNSNARWGIAITDAWTRNREVTHRCDPIPWTETPVCRRARVAVDTSHGGYRQKCLQTECAPLVSNLGHWDT